MIKTELDKTAFSISSLDDNFDERSYWLSKTPQERIAAIELFRQINYGEDAVTQRLQRFFEVVKLSQC
jgi:hypothetical protein